MDRTHDTRQFREELPLLWGYAQRPKVRLTLREKRILAWELGRELVVLKEALGHGGFMATLEQLGIARGYAQRCRMLYLYFSREDAPYVRMSRLRLPLLREKGGGMINMDH